MTFECCIISAFRDFEVVKLARTTALNPLSLKYDV